MSPVCNSKLLALGCPADVQPDAPVKPAVTSAESSTDKAFRDLAMHGSLERMKDIAAQVNPNSTEAGSGRTPLHKAAYFGHAKVISYLVNVHAVDIDVQDADGDTALHDAARFGDVDCITVLLAAGADETVANLDGQTPLDLAVANERPDVITLFGLNSKRGASEQDCAGCTIL